MPEQGEQTAESKQTQPPAQPNPFVLPGKPKKRKKRVQRAAYVTWIVIVLAGGLLLGYVQNHPLFGELVNNLTRHDPPAEVFDSPDLTVLILGTDEDRAPGGRKIDRESARSDMIMVAKLHFAEQRVTGISIPRDTLARVKGAGVHRVNAFHAIGGPKLAREAVENITGLQIDRVVVINYNVFKEIVDMIDGVQVNVKKRLKYDDDRGHLHIDLEPGVQTLDGAHAMGFVRYRRDSDFERQARQRQFIVAFKAQAFKKWTRLGAVSDKVGELTGNAFSDQELISLLFFAKDVKDEDIKLGALPIIEGSNYNLSVDKGKLYSTLKEFELIES